MARQIHESQRFQCDARDFSCCSAGDDLWPVLDADRTAALHLTCGRRSPLDDFTELGRAAECVNQAGNGARLVHIQRLAKSAQAVNRISVDRTCQPRAMKESSPKDPAGRLRFARKRAGFASARSAAIRHGWKPSTYGSHENGQTPVPQDAAEEYAKAFKTSVAWLLTGDAPAEQIVQITGAVLKHGAVEMLDMPVRHRRPGATSDTPSWAWLPFGIVSGTLVLQVRDRGMSPRYEHGDLILVEENPVDFITANPEVVGEEVLVMLEAGGLFVKRMFKAKQPGKFDLEGINCPAIKDASVARVFRIIGTVRHGVVGDLAPSKARAARNAPKLI